MNGSKISNICILALMLVNTFVFSQAPDLVNYQGVALNTSGTPIANTVIRLRVTISNGTFSGTTLIYQEERSVTTDATGLFNFQIGGPGTTTTSIGSIASIDWGNQNKYLKVEMDPTNGTNYIVMGEQQLVSVPFAKFADKFKLPFEESTLATTDVFSISNNSTTSATTIKGTSMGNSNTSRGVAGIATGTNGIGVYGSSINGDAIVGVSDENTNFAIKGTNTADGTAIKGISSAPVGSVATIDAQNNGGGVALKGTTTSSGTSSAAIIGENTGSTVGTGVLGQANGASAYGVYGSSTAGIGTYGFSSTGYGLSGFAISGTAVRANSSTGYAIESNGKLKLSGGNMTPSDGAVLTSDATGNAVWQNNKIGFCVRKAENQFLNNNVQTKVEFSSENYDLQNNFTPFAGTTTTSSSKFVAPVSGVYYFSASLKLDMSSTTNNFNYGTLDLMVNSSSFFSYTKLGENTLVSSEVPLSLSTSVYLNAGDAVWIRVKQANTSGTQQAIDNFISNSHFTGYLLFAD